MATRTYMTAPGMRYSMAEANAKATEKPAGGSTSRKQIKRAKNNNKRKQNRKANKLNSVNANILYTC